MKAYKIIDKDKIFINICQSNAIPPPEDITTDELTKVLKSDTSTFRVPMSITEPRITKDKSHKDATVCDVAIHPDFFKKVERIKLFADFLITIIFEALATKYNIEVDQSNWVTLRNRKVMGTLITHRIQNRDVIKVCESYETPPEGSKAIIEELEKDKPKSNNNDGNSKLLIEEIDAEHESKTLEYSLVFDESKNIIADFYMPDVLKCNEIYLSVDGDSIVLSVPSCGYHLNECLPYTLDPVGANAKFGMNTHVSMSFL